MDDISQSKILIVEDAETNIDILMDALEEDYEISVATDGETALEILDEEAHDLILMDIMMPGIDGYETCRRVKENHKLRNIPIIFITGKAETRDMIKGFQVGGVDYITKPFHKEEVCARVRNHLELQFLKKKDEERMKTTMARYLGPELVDNLMESGQEVMGTSNHETTVLFSDIRSFTTLSEELGVQETINMLNDYFTQMVGCIKSEKGMLDKFIGDAIMAVFGTPMPYDDHADCGVRAAISMINALNSFNEKRKREGKNEIKIGIGLNSSPVIAGNIGSLDRMDYTVIGDGVNLAARLEGATKIYGAQILISEYTFKELKGDYLIRELDRITLKGKTKPRRIFEVLDFHNDDSFPNKDKVLELFDAGSHEYKSGNWNISIKAFKDALNLNPNDKACQVFIDRCEYLKSGSNGKDWNGIWELQSK